MKIVPVLYEDDDILIVNKPAGLAVQGGEGVVNSLCSILETQTARKIYLAHRLDRDTAGIIAAAKTQAAASHLTSLIASSAVKKEYTAVCFGIPPEKKGIIDSAVSRKGVEKSALTEYRVLDVSDSYSLLSLTLGTGRTHQIRIHLASMSVPIVADDKYGDFRLNREIRSSLGVRKLQLAAVRLTLPLYGRNQTFEIPLPDHMRDFREKVFHRS